MEALRVIVPYKTRKAVQHQVLDMQSIEPEWYRCDDSDSYWMLLKRQWDRREAFIVLEHDILPWPGALEDLWRCREPWCAFGYHMGGHMGYAFGCTKFTTELMDAMPDIVDGLPDRHWFNLDSQFIHTAHRVHNLDYHRHGPPVIHLNSAHMSFKVKPEVVREGPKRYQLERAIS